jgi:hypothetical protein
MIHIAVVEVAAELAPLLVVDGRLEVAGWVSDSLDLENDAKLAVGIQRETTLSCTAE